MKKQLISKACKQSVSFLWHPNRLNKKLKLRIAKTKKKQLHFRRIKEQSNRQTNLKIQLDHTREMKALFGGFPEKQRKTNLFYAKKQTKNIRHAFLLGLEMRLDTCLFRTNFFPTFGAARQAIQHGFISINGRQVKQATRVLRPSDFIQVHKSNSWKINFMNSLKKRNLLKRNAQHIETNPKIAAAIILYNPQQIFYPFSFKLPAGNL